MAILGYVGMLLAFAFIVFLWIFCSNRKSVLINWPGIGMVPGLLSNRSRVLDLATDLLHQNGGTALFKGPWFSGMDFVVTSDPTNVNYILTKNFANYPKGNEFREIMEPLGDGILASDSNTHWKIQKKLIHSLFNDKRFKDSVKRIIELKVLHGLFPVLENASKLGNEVDLQDILQRLTFDYICMLLFGFEPNCLSIEFPHVDIEKAFHDMEEAVLRRYFVPTTIWKLQRYLQIGTEKSLSTSWKILQEFVVQHIATKRDQLNKPTEEFDVLTYFLSLEDEENGDLIKSNKFLIDMAFNLLGAGRDTIAAALGWLFWLVGTHPFVERKILQELQENLEIDYKDDQDLKTFRFEELNKLVYLHAVICEVLRLYPTIPFERIVSVNSDTLPSGHKIPENFKITYCLYTMGRMEEIWGKDCLEFKPERWISEEGEIIHVPSYKFIAFNAGPRSCLGKNLTFMQMKAIASSILWNYRVQVVQHHPVDPSVSIVLYMRNGLKIRVSKRNG